MEGFPAKRWAIGGALALLCTLALAAHAQDKALGKQLYEANCASCHGPTARGSGWLAQYLTRTPPPLNDLTKRNGGAFPEESARTVIDGRKQVALHGPRDMPVWGAVFQADYKQHAITPSVAVSPEPPHFPPPMAGETYVRENIDALLAYLVDIQR